MDESNITIETGVAPSANGDAFAKAVLLKAERDALLRIREIREANGLAFYRPHLKQHRFHTSLATARYLRTGNRFGKSECGIAEDIAMCLGGRLWYRSAFDILDGEKCVAIRHPGGHNHPLVTAGIPQRPLKGLVLIVDWAKAKEIFTGRDGSFDTWGKLWKLLPRESVGKIFTGGRGDRIEKIEIKRPAEFGGGVSTLSFDTIESYKHSKIGAESSDYDFIHVDEPVPEKMFKAHSRGLMDRDGKSWFTCTPLDEMWINDAFCPPKQNVVRDAGDGLAFGRKFMITGDTRDNPYRNEQGVAEYEASLTREERACRISGLPLAFSGMIYREFIYDLHVLCDVPNGWDAYHLPPLDYTIRVAWDVHDAKPQAILIAATAPNNVCFICHEMFDERMIKPNATLLKQWLEGRFVLDLLIDPKAVNPDPRDDSTILDDLWAEGLCFDKGSKDLTLGISRVREKLNERTHNGLPTICFSPLLTETLFEFTHYVYSSKTNKPKDENDHQMENLYRLVLNGLDYIPPGESNFKPKTSNIGFEEDLVSFKRERSLNLRLRDLLT